MMLQFARRKEFKVQMRQPILLKIWSHIWHSMVGDIHYHCRNYALLFVVDDLAPIPARFVVTAFFTFFFIVRFVAATGVGATADVTWMHSARFKSNYKSVLLSSSKGAKHRKYEQKFFIHLWYYTTLGHNNKEAWFNDRKETPIFVTVSAYPMLSTLSSSQLIWKR